MKRAGWYGMVGGLLMGMAAWAELPRCVTPDGGWNGVFAPDGGEIVYVARGTNGEEELRLGNLETLETVAVGVRGDKLQRVPDSEWILFLAPGHFPVLEYFRPSDRQSRDFTDKATPDGPVVVLPGGRIYWAAEAVTQAYDLNQRDFVEPAFELPDHTLAVSPDGRLAVVERREAERPVLEVIEIATGKLRHLLEGFGGTGKVGVYAPVFTPDGRQLLYASGEAPERAKLFCLTLEDGVAVELSAELDGRYPPAFSPDGCQLLFTAVTDGRPNLWLISWPPEIE